MPDPTDPFQTIDPTALTQVSGGAAAAASSDNQAVLSALDGILDSIQSIAKGNQQGGFGATEMMMFMMMLQGRSGTGGCVHANPQSPFVCGTSKVDLK